MSINNAAAHALTQERNQFAQYAVIGIVAADPVGSLVNGALTAAQAFHLADHMVAMSGVSPEGVEKFLNDSVNGEQGAEKAADQELTDQLQEIPNNELENNSAASSPPSGAPDPASATTESGDTPTDSAATDTPSDTNRPPLPPGFPPYPDQQYVADTPPLGYAGG